jgi:hypothetical protein
MRGFLDRMKNEELTLAKTLLDAFDNLTKFL